MQTGSSGTLIGWKSGQTTFVPLWDRMEGAWQWTQQASVPHPPPPPLWFEGGGRAHSLAGEGMGESQFRRRDIHCGILCTFVTAGAPVAGVTGWKENNRTTCGLVVESADQMDHVGDVIQILELKRRHILLSSQLRTHQQFSKMFLHDFLESNLFT
jgi:hypothetical protein